MIEYKPEPTGNLEQRSRTPKPAPAPAPAHYSKPENPQPLKK